MNTSPHAKGPSWATSVHQDRQVDQLTTSQMCSSFQTICLRAEWCVSDYELSSDTVPRQPRNGRRLRHHDQQSVARLAQTNERHRGFLFLVHRHTCAHTAPSPRLNIANLHFEDVLQSFQCRKTSETSLRVPASFPSASDLETKPPTTQEKGERTMSHWPPLRSRLISLAECKKRPLGLPSFALRLVAAQCKQSSPPPIDASQFGGSPYARRLFLAHKPCDIAVESKRSREEKE